MCGDLPAGGKVPFSVGLRGKGGVDLKDAVFQVTAIGPNNQTSEVPTAREATDERGTFWKTDAPGEYRLEVYGKGKDVDGREIEGKTSVQSLLVYQDDSELAVRAANHDFLLKLASAGGGTFHRAQDLPKFLKELAEHASAQE